MIRIITEISLEVTKPNIIQAIVAKQYDMNTRFIKATLVDGDNVVEIPKRTDGSIKVVINAERPDGTKDSFEGEVNGEDDTVTVPLHSWMLELDGTVICDISIIDTKADDNKKLTTTSFTLLVEKAAYGGSDITNDPQYDVLVSLLETCNTASVVAEEALQKSREANSKYEACVEATENANKAAEEASAVRSEIEAGGFVESLKELNSGGKFEVWIGTQAEYDAIGTKRDNCLYLITDKPVADYIVEQGKSEDWTYRKWSSGLVECWVNRIDEITFTKKNAAYTTAPMYYSDAVKVALPPIFTTVDRVSLDAVRDSKAFILTAQVQPWKTCESISYIYLSNFDFPDDPYVRTEITSIYVMGTWK